MVSHEFRLSYPECRKLLQKRLAERAPRRVQLLSGPRQVGKTTLLLELAKNLGEQSLYAAADSPEAALPGHWERLWQSAEETARRRRRAIVFLDEVHLFPDWAARLKGVVDGLRRKNAPIHVVATGSSALRVTSGSTESLAGRFEHLTLTHWTAASISQSFNISPNKAAQLVVHMGAYPGSYPIRNDPPRWTAYIRDAILEPAIGRDILALAKIQRPGLLRQVFAVAALSPAKIVSLQKIQGQLQDSGALETIAYYLKLLEEAYLVAALPKYSVRPFRRRSAPPKVITLSNALLAVTDPAGIPTSDSARLGAWVENACLAHAWNAGQGLSYWREEPFEVDGVLEGSWGSWALEVKMGKFRVGELSGLLEFTRRHPRFRPLVVCEKSGLWAAEHVGIQATTWQQFLLKGPPREAQG